GGGARGEVRCGARGCGRTARLARYETATGRAGDVQRYLAGDTVEACPPTLGYRLGKAYRRNRAAVNTVAAVFFAAVFGVAAQTWGFLQGRGARRGAGAAGGGAAQEGVGAGRQGGAARRAKGGGARGK